MQLLNDYFIMGAGATLGYSVISTVIGIVNAIIYSIFAPKRDDS